MCSSKILLHNLELMKYKLFNCAQQKICKKTFQNVKEIILKLLHSNHKIMGCYVMETKNLNL